MTVRTFPYDILAGFPGTTTRFELSYVQELAPTRGGQQNSADLGPALWEADFQTVELSPLTLRRWKARLASLENGQQTMTGYDLTSCFPMAYPNGTWPTGGAFAGSGNLNEVDTGTYKQIKIGGLPAGYVVSEGDYVSFTYSSTKRALHQAMESVTVVTAGITPFFEVRPHIRTGYTLATAVALIKPHAVMVLIPGSISQGSGLTGRGSISFSARQTI